MQEKEVTRSVANTQPAEGSLVFSIRSRHYLVNGKWSWDLHSTSVYCSDVMDFPVEFEGTKGIVHPDDLPGVVTALHQLETEGAAAFDFRLITTYGEIKFLKGRNVSLDEAIAAKAESPEPWAPFLKQMALRREAEALQQRNALADTTERLYNAGSFAVNKSTGEAWYSDGMYRIHGLPPQSLNHHANTFLSFVHPDDHLPFLDAFEAAYAGELPLHIEYRIQLPDGLVKPVRLITQWSYTQKGQPLFSGLLRDLAEEINAANEMAEAQNKLLLHQQALRIAEQSWNTGYWFVDLLSRKATFSENLFRIYGLKQQGASSIGAFLALVHPDDRDRVKDLAEKMYNEHLLPEAEFRILRQDGRQRQLKQMGKLITTPTQTVMVITVQDVTVQRGLEKKLAELTGKTKWQEAIQQASEAAAQSGVITWHPEKRMTWTEGVFHLLGYKHGAVEPSSKLLHQKLHSDDSRQLKEAEASLLGEHLPEAIRFQAADRGVSRLLSLSFQRLSTDPQGLTIGVLKDITQQEALLQKLTASVHFSERLQNLVSEILFLTDTDNTVLSWNTAAEEKTGIKTADAVFSNLFDLFPQLKDEGYRSRLQEAFHGTEIREPKARNLYLRKAHHYTLIPFKNESGEVVRILHMAQDVSKELTLQQQLSERLRFIESLVDASVDRIVALDVHMNYLYWNRKAEEYYGLPKEEVIGRNILEIFPGLRNDPSYSEFRRVLRGENVYLPPVAIAGSSEYFETYLIPVTDELADVTAILWVVHDLSHEAALQQVQRKAQRQMEEEHRRLKEAQAIGRVGSFEWNADTDKILWSDEMYRIHGMAPQSEEITLAKALSFVPAEDDDIFRQLSNLRHSAGRIDVTHRLIRTDGKTIFVRRQAESFADAGGKITHLVGTLQDVTEQKKARDRIQEQAHYLQRILETGPDMISIMDLSTQRAEYLNEEAFEAQGFGREYMASLSAQEMRETIHADDRPAMAAYFEAVTKASDEDIVSTEYRAINSRGELKWFIVRSKVFQRDTEGKATHSLNVIEEISARKKAEREILELKERIAQKATDKYYSLFNAIDEGFALCELVRDDQGKAFDYRFLEINPAFETHFRCKRQDVVGRRRNDVIQPDDEAVTMYANVVASGEQLHREYYSRAEKQWYDISVFPQDGDKFAVVFDNITERKDWELKLKAFNESLERQVADRTAELMQSRDLLQSIYENIPIGISLLQPVRNTAGQITDFKILITNTALNKETGRTDLAGKLYAQEYPGIKPAGIFELAVKAAKTGERQGMEYLYPYEGFNKWYFCQFIKTAGGVLATNEDITPRKAAEEEITKNLTILNQAEEIASIGSWEYQIPNGRFRWSEGMYRIFEHPANAPVQPELYLDRATEEDR